LADAADEALRIYPKLPSRAGAAKIDEPYLLGRNHAKGNLLAEAVNLGVQPQMLIASNHFCEEFCENSLRSRAMSLAGDTWSG
jgi:hypothetical protein